MPSERLAAGPRVFLSYRRRDSPGEAGRLHDNLVARRPRWEVFLDIGFIRPGRDFISEIDAFLSSCQLLIPVIGPRWLAPGGTDELRPLDNPADTVRLELERGEARGVPALPVLVNDALMPKLGDLPPTLGWLATVNAARLRHDSFERDLTAVLESADSILLAADRDVLAEVVDRTRRSRTLRVRLRAQTHLVHFETRHSGAHRLMVDGASVPHGLLRDFGSRLTLNKEYRFELADGSRSAPAVLNVRYLSDLLWLIGMRLTVDGYVVHDEGRLL
jgi:hypothetical protein